MLRGVGYTKSRRDEAIPLLKEFIGLDSLEMAHNAYDRLKYIWPDNGLPSDRGWKNLLSMGEVPANVPPEKIADWSYVKEAAAALRIK